jgi:hypothetical protein
MNILKIKDGFLLKEVAGNFVVVPVGSNLVDFSAMITINETGAFLWEHLQNETNIEALVEKLTKEYDIDKETARKDTEEFIKILAENNII